MGAWERGNMTISGLSTLNCKGIINHGMELKKKKTTHRFEKSSWSSKTTKNYVWIQRVEKVKKKKKKTGTQKLKLGVVTLCGQFDNLEEQNNLVRSRTKY